mmetsp:Transcript_48224/g.151471  ORF Transcript_48224/g.151471 Transcript_48224/m.151471 type:complete len:872 (+) Transcript_48224:29-2644(+)
MLATCAPSRATVARPWLRRCDCGILPVPRRQPVRNSHFSSERLLHSAVGCLVAGCLHRRLQGWQRNIRTFTTKAAQATAVAAEATSMAPSDAVSIRVLVSQCVDLTERAGQLIREVSDKAARGAPASELGLVNKGEGEGTFDPQTLADRRAQRCIVENLRGVYGASIKIVGEEGDLGLGDDSEAEASVAIAKPDEGLLDSAWPEEQDVQFPLAELCVWVDPLDGTREFTEGRYEYVSTLVGISRLGRPVAGVISEPYAGGPSLGRILWGCCVGPGDPAPCIGVHVYGQPDWSRPARPEGRCTVLVSRSRAGGAVADAVARLSEPGTAGPLAAGKALITGSLAAGGAGHKVARVVDGAADLWLFPRPGTSRWDTCAAEAMLEALGGALRDQAGQRIQYDPDGEMGNNGGVLAGADGQIVEDAARVCSTLDAARNAEGGALSRSFLEASLGLDHGTLVGFAADPSSVVRGKHSSVLRLNLCHQAGESAPASVMLKRVVPKDLEARGSRKWLRDAASYRAEINFFRLYAALLAERGVRVPKVYHVVSEGVGKLSPAADAAADEEALAQAVMDCRFLVLAEDFHPDGYRQDLELAGPSLQAALRLAAGLHGSTFEDEALLQGASADLFAEGAYWDPAKRDPGELDALPASWEALAASLAEEAVDLFASPRIRSLGERLRAASPFVNEALRGNVQAEPFKRRCLVHGDLKTANVFIDRTSGEAVPIDFQWTGVNYGAQDVAYLLLGSTALDEVSDGRHLEELLQLYWRTFSEALATRSTEAAPPTDYAFEDFCRLFKLSCLDYTRIVFGYQLKGRSAAWVRNGAGLLGRCTHNRSMPTLLGLVRFVDALLSELESTGDLSGATASMPGFGAVLSAA